MSNSNPFTEVKTIELEALRLIAAPAQQVVDTQGDDFSKVVALESALTHYEQCKRWPVDKKPSGVF